MEIIKQSSFFGGIITGVEITPVSPGIAINLVVQNRVQAALAYLGTEVAPNLTPADFVTRAQSYGYLITMYAIVQRGEGEQVTARLYSTKRELLINLASLNSSSSELVPT